MGALHCAWMASHYRAASMLKEWKWARERWGTSHSALPAFVGIIRALIDGKQSAAAVSRDCGRELRCSVPMNGSGLLTPGSFPVLSFVWEQMYKNACWVRNTHRVKGRLEVFMTAFGNVFSFNVTVRLWIDIMRSIIPPCYWVATCAFWHPSVLCVEWEDLILNVWRGAMREWRFLQFIIHSWKWRFSQFWFPKEPFSEQLICIYYKWYVLCFMLLPWWNVYWQTKWIHSHYYVFSFYMLLDTQHKS